MREFLSYGRIINSILQTIDLNSNFSIYSSYYSTNGTIISEEVFSIADSLLHWFIKQKKLVIIYNLSQDPTMQMHRKLIRKNKLSSYLEIPLVTQGKTIGILHIMTVKPRTFTDEDIEFFQTLAGQAAIALRAAYLFDQVRESEKRYRDIFENAAYVRRYYKT